MKNALFRAAAASLVLLALVSCGGGDAGPSGAPPSGGGGGGPPPAITGNAVNSSTGAAGSNVAVTAAAQSTTTDAQGGFTLATVPAGNVLLLFTSNSYALQAREVTVVSGVTTSVSVQLVPVAAAPVFDPTMVQVLTVPGSVAQVSLAAGSLRTAGAALPTGQVTGRLTPINVSQESELLPGDYTVSLVPSGTAQFESFGAFDITFTDAAGNALTLDPAQPATIRIPVGTRSAGPLPATTPLIFFDVTTGLWVQEGTATLQGAAPNQYYEGTVTHFGNWSAGALYTVSIITACLLDAGNQPVAGARLTSDGINYSGNASATTDAQGVALVPMKRGAQAIISATSGTRLSNTVTISAAQSAGDFTLSPCLVLAAPNSGMAIKLTWGAAPSDLDSHLMGPNSTHVDFTNLGSLTAAPFARLDVDDVTSFGPEVVTITRLARGTYRYFVHNFSQTFSPGMTGSPARVEVRFGANTQIHAPPAGEGANLYWHVFDFTVAADCSVIITPANVWSAAEPANPSGTATGEYCAAVEGPQLPLPPP
jgi:hypothetical protein